MNQEQISALVQRYQAEAADTIPFPVAPAAKLAVKALQQYGGDETALLEELERRAAEDARANKKHPGNRLYAAFEQRAARLREMAEEIRREPGLFGTSFQGVKEKQIAPPSQTPNWEWIAEQLQAMQVSVQLQDFDGIRCGVYTLLEALEQWRAQKPHGLDRLFGPLIERQKGEQRGT